MRICPRTKWKWRSRYSAIDPCNFSQFKLHCDYTIVFSKNQCYNNNAVKRPAERGDARAGFFPVFACARSECNCRDSWTLHNQVAGEQVAGPQHSTSSQNRYSAGQGGTASAVPFRFYSADLIISIYRSISSLPKPYTSLIS